MGQIVYRNLKEEDYPAVADILSQAFGLHRYVSDPRLLQIIQQQYIYSCLSEATFARIAEEYGLSLIHISLNDCVSSAISSFVSGTSIESDKF